jgi:hypothetical protein
VFPTFGWFLVLALFSGQAATPDHAPLEFGLLPGADEYVITGGGMKGMVRLVHPRPARRGRGRRPGWSAVHPGCDGLAVNAAELHCDQESRP